MTESYNPITAIEDQVTGFPRHRERPVCRRTLRVEVEEIVQFRNVQKKSKQLSPVHKTRDYLMAPNPVVPAADKVTPEAKTATSTQRVAQLTGHLAPPAETEQVNNHPDLDIPYPVSKFRIDPNRFIDNVREVKVAVIGAGLSGISAGIMLPAKVPGIKLTIFEKNRDVVSVPAKSFFLYL